MKNLMFKEISIAIVKWMYLFALFPAMLLIPHYPYIVPMGYIACALFCIFKYAEENHDHLFSASLPIKRSDIVSSKMFTVFLFEAITLVAAIPFALLSSLVINKNGNPVGLDANITFFGCTLIEYAVFNLVFLPLYFRTGHKAGIPVLLAIICYAVTGVILELCIGLIPALRILDSKAPSSFGYQAIVLGIGAIIFVLSAIATKRISVKNFLRVNL